MAETFCCTAVLLYVTSQTRIPTNLRYLEFRPVAKSLYHHTELSGMLKRFGYVGYERRIIMRYPGYGGHHSGVAGVMFALFGSATQ